MSNNAIKVISILFVLMMVFLPMGWILLSNEPPGAYYIAEKSQVEEFLKSTGLGICEKTESTWKVQGATGGFSVLLSDDCSASSMRTAAIHVQNFDSIQNRDHAVQMIKNSINIHNYNGAVYTYGSYVIAVQGPTGGAPIEEQVSKVRAALKNK